MKGDGSGGGQSNSPTTAQKKKKEQGVLNPEFTNLQWKIEDKVVEEAMVGQELKLTADGDQLGEAKSVTIKIYEKDYNNPDDFITDIPGTVKEGKITGTWIFEYHEDTDDVNSEQEQEEKGYTKPEYVFTVETNDGKHVSDKGPVCEMKDWIELELTDRITGKPLANEEFTIKTKSGDEIKGKLDENGKGRIDKLPPGKHEVIIGDNDYKIVFKQDEK